MNDTIQVEQNYILLNEETFQTINEFDKNTSYVLKSDFPNGYIERYVSNDLTDENKMKHIMGYH